MREGFKLWVTAVFLQSVASLPASTCALAGKNIKGCYVVDYMAFLPRNRHEEVVQCLP